MVQLYLDVPSTLDKAAKTFEALRECTYATKSLGSSGQTEIMTCDCGKTAGSDEVMCGDNSDCINRLTSIECIGDRCGCSGDCGNRRFQRHQHAQVDVFGAGPKGFGVRALADIKADGFIYEYTGEVVDQARFLRRKRQYEQQGITHFYFMMLQKDEFIDATLKGSIARFCNHSCSPNAYIDKWVVGPKLRMGLFAKRDIAAGEEITFDYNVDRYGAAAQPCYCYEANCTGWLGGKTQTNGLALPPLVADALGLTIEEEEEWQSQFPKNQKRKDLDAELAESLPVKPLDVQDVSRLMAALMQQKAEPWLSRKLVDRIFVSQDQSVHIEVMRMHGYEIFASLLTLHNAEEKLAEKVLQTLACWPQMTRNKISSSKIEGVVKGIAESAEDSGVQEQARELLDAWSALQMAYRIPRRERDASKDAASETETTASVPDSPKPTPVSRNTQARLPPGWEQKTSSNRTVYYINAKTQETSDRVPDQRELKRLREVQRELEAEKEREAARQALLREEREKQAEILDKIIADAVAAEVINVEAESTPPSSVPTPGEDTPHGSKKPVSLQKRYTILLAKYVPKIVWRYEPQLGRDRCKRHAHDIVRLLVEKELKRENLEVPDELTDERKKKVRHFVVPYMEKALAHYLKKGKRVADGKPSDLTAKRQKA
ncbi:Histone-lysine N-methyltransferase, H3 lysine-36 specific [Wickerhamiella sorbophila]|uniref:Histone-lysine N-methyltransferase, H3 lysine-36 specific n=1 Tax=Wickerhamiella sorbophila TaxID=45607 RepID=A0A2T0FCJ6_9ASCO|nr:Histone-lysine N-methyltransferase, H3 lysine-36 specific [Wickerhamiella sorbophila]PRT52728.1 Histone-lysine N-methyltransferase, H3 lysine-36 specific [Wickerhamiella sorbophila]